MRTIILRLFLGLSLTTLYACITPKEDAPDPVSTISTEYNIVVYRTANLGGNEITITVNKVNAGKITSINSIAPDCDSKNNGYVKYKVKKGSYFVEATGSNGEGWEATVDIVNTGCYFLSISN